VILTDHAEHLNEQERQDQELLAAASSQAGKICLPGYEVTGTDELSDTSSKDPAYQHGWGHLVVVNTPSFAGRTIFGNGKPPVLVITYNDFLNWLARYPEGMGIFAHPSLYMDKESFNGFAAPPNITAINQLVGCELSSHGLTYSGLGNGKELRSSNEACYRQLLRAGWRVGAYMSGDEHLSPYGATNTVTGFYVVEKSQAGLLEAMRARRTFATEEPGALIALVGQSESGTSIMGQALDLGTKDNIFHVRCTSKQSTLSAITLVLISAKGATFDTEIISQQLTQSDEHWGTIISQSDIVEKGFCLAYSKAKLKNGRQLVSSPIWFKAR
jgi:hypothetical protein